MGLGIKGWKWKWLLSLISWRFSSKVFGSCPHDFRLCWTRALSSKRRNTPTPPPTWGHNNDANKLKIKSATWSHWILHVIGSMGKAKTKTKTKLILMLGDWSWVSRGIRLLLHKGHEEKECFIHTHRNKHGYFLRDLFGWQDSWHNTPTHEYV